MFIKGNSNSKRMDKIISSVSFNKNTPSPREFRIGKTAIFLRILAEKQV